MEKQKKLHWALPSILIGVVALVALVATLYMSNEYYLELSIPNETISLEYGIDSMPQVEALCKGTVFNRKGTPVDTQITGEVDLQTLGTYTVSYQASYNHMTLSENRTFVVTDNTAPEIVLISDPNHFTSPAATYVEEGFTATDNYDGDLTANVKRQETKEKIIYTVSDSQGNTTSVERIIVYKDVIAPVITLIGGTEITSDIGKDFMDPGFTATDDCDGDLTAQVKVDGTVDSKKAGNYKLIYTIEDTSGNLCKMERLVRVGDFKGPDLKLKGETDSYIKLGSSYKDPGFTATDNIDGDVTSQVKVSGKVDTGKTGTHTITYTVTDRAGNQTKRTRTVFVYKQQAVSNPKDPGNKVIYLTFDDGPGKYTKQLLDILDKYNVKATFFVTNQYPSYQNMIGEAHRRGHTIALHTYTHDYSNIYKSESAYYADLEKIHNLCVKQTGVNPTIVRFPGGTANSVSKRYCKGIMSKISKSLSYHGYLFSDWNVDSGDAAGATTAKQVANNVINGVKKRNRSIVLQHDIKKYSVEAVDQIIFWGIENGYTFLPMTNDTPMVHHSVTN